jgi:hypothetical protein
LIAEKRLLRCGEEAAARRAPEPRGKRRRGKARRRRRAAAAATKPVVCALTPSPTGGMQYFWKILTKRGASGLRPGAGPRRPTTGVPRRLRARVQKADIGCGVLPCWPRVGVEKGRAALAPSTTSRRPPRFSRSSKDGDTKQAHRTWAGGRAGGGVVYYYVLIVCTPRPRPKFHGERSGGLDGLDGLEGGMDGMGWMDCEGR